MKPLNILIWHVHGSWLAAFVRGGHRYLIPVAPEATTGGRRAEWPETVCDVTLDEARAAHIDVVVAQRPQDIVDAPHFLGSRRLGTDVPLLFLEHNAPQGLINAMRHPLADRGDVTLVHVTHFNALFWECGSTVTRLVEHGIPDPGYRYTGELERVAVVINEAERRGRVTGTDLLARFEREAAPLDRFGIGTARDLPMDALHAAIAQRRAYLHPFRWTSLGLALLEAMACGMPVAALATTEVPYAVPPGTGIVSNDPGELVRALRGFIAEPEAARELGRRARAHVLERYGLARFLAAWDELLAEAVA